MNPIKILIVGMSPDVGGIENFVIQTLRNIDSEKFTFDILTFCTRCAYEDEITARGSSVFHITRRGENPIKNYIEQVHFFKNAQDYDYVWLHLSSASDINTLKLVKKYTKSKIICHSHGSSFESRGGVVHLLHTWMHHKNQSILTNITDYHFACSTQAGEWLYGNRGEYQLILIPNAVDLEKFTFEDKKRILMREELGINADALVVGHVGRLTAIKNQSFLIQVYSVFQKEHSNSLLLIAGEGPLKDDLEEEARKLGIYDKVRFLGFRSDIDNLLLAFDLFLLPSLSEGFPVTLVEAQASGLPSVISDTITREVGITDLVHFVSIEADEGEWVIEMNHALKHPRDSKNYEIQLESSGYTPKVSAEIIQNILIGGIK